ncbi:CLUMA_CG007324, isoform A [Clunio marinus]|uniref:CLUMA_CG007324, isoform A n=1 Tax=Clunio marinus TaxID=568069 RepID=A0A1J1I2H5_9DIPT|nr:CLUMA_CG007324, isoform A [Clunio marinus]
MRSSLLSNLLHATHSQVYQSFSYISKTLKKFEASFKNRYKLFFDPKVLGFLHIINSYKIKKLTNRFPLKNKQKSLENLHKSLQSNKK